MSRLLDADTLTRKTFAFHQIQGIPEWNDVHSIDDFDMVQNNGRLGIHFANREDGLTNIIYKLSKKANEDDYPILFRIYGAGEDLGSEYDFVGSSDYLNRGNELVLFEALSKSNYGIKLLRSFPEGRLELWRVGYYVCHRSFNEV